MIEAFLVDDEEPALKLLELFLTRSGMVNVTGRFSNGLDALHELEKRKKPDVWFLDIEMPRMNGMELAERIRSYDPDVAIVYVTAYDQYAIKAFEHAALDYLLKPLEQDRLFRTIARLNKEAAARAVTAPLTKEEEKLSIRMLGTFYAETSSKQVFKWRTAKEKELLVYLALQQGTPVHRDRIIEDLWPDDPFQKARVYLHTCISLIRKHLTSLGLSGLLLYDKERYRLDADRVEVDALLFKSNLSTLKDSEASTIDSMEETLEQYKGNLLQDEDYPWAIMASEKLKATALEWLLKAAELRLAEGHFVKAIETADRVVHLSPCDEHAYRILMQAYLMLGQHEQVHRTYKRLSVQLAELHVGPSAVTQQIYETISI
ncbi:response regulator [Paenibacillus sp. GCM10027627]|uniref:response regulator n=1 Tax=unclassified Paenibacillus TaxID=185978 RepID=UPI00362F8F9E